jgi:hypothetical protein
MAAESGLWFGLQADYVRYEEPGLMSEEGLLAGVWVGYGVDFAGAWFGRVAGSWVAGELEYRTDPGYPLELSTRTPNNILDLRLELGRRMQLWTYPLGPYVGAGYRLLVDDIPDIREYQGYRREQTYLYVPIGVEVGVLDHAPWAAALRLEYDLFVEGQNRSDGDSLRQDSGFGLRAVLAASYGREFLWFRHVRMEPFAQYWEVARSNVSRQGFLEPENHSTMVGLSVGAGF